MNLTPEIIEKAKQAASAEEILTLAKENGMEMTEEQATAYFAQLHPASGEISDDELDNVAGGGCHSGDGRLVITCNYSCSNWEDKTQYRPEINCYVPCNAAIQNCQSCKHRTVEHELWLCNHPANKN